MFKIYYQFGFADTCRYRQTIADLFTCRPLILTLTLTLPFPCPYPFSTPDPDPHFNSDPTPTLTLILSDYSEPFEFGLENGKIALRLKEPLDYREVPYRWDFNLYSMYLVWYIIDTFSFSK